MRYVGVLCEVFTPRDPLGLQAFCLAYGWTLKRFEGCNTVRLATWEPDGDIQGVTWTLSTFLIPDAHAVLEIVAVQEGAEAFYFLTGERITIIGRKQYGEG